MANPIAGHCHLSNEALEWIEGELLGDGNLTSSTSSARFRYGSKYLEYINYVSDTLASFGINQAGKIRKRVVPTVCYYYSSLSYTDLFDVWVLWYAYGQKQIPRGLELTPLVCRQWYIGDGSMNTTSAKNPYIRIYTQGFLVQDVLWLIGKLKHLGFVASYQSNNTLYIPTKYAKKFLTYIGECPVGCYKYKWIQE